jgi:hypothetical protein
VIEAEINRAASRIFLGQVAQSIAALHELVSVNDPAVAEIAARQATHGEPKILEESVAVALLKLTPQKPPAR